MAYRRDLIEILATGPRTASSLARELGLARRDMADELQHIVRSARTAGYEVRVEPARCKSCGFLFGETKLTKPGKCPSCKGTRLYEPLIRLEKGSTIPARMTWSH